jgi:predicted amidohydrolase
MNRTMLDASRPIDGQPLEFLRDLARVGRAYVGGSYLARSGDDVFNTFVLACPDGRTFSHDKDFPSTVTESSFYAGGEDDAYVRKLAQDGATTKAERIVPRNGNNVDGVFALGDVDVGAAMCWELIRFRTAKRLRGKIDILLGASCWWKPDPEIGWPGRTRDQLVETRAAHLLLIGNAPRSLARMLGVPVVHANCTGLNPGFVDSTFEQRVTARHLGCSQIVDAHGEVVAKLADEEGVVVGDVDVSRVSPVEEIPDAFWMPGMSESQQKSWSVTGAAGRDYYLSETRPYLRKSR